MFLPRKGMETNEERGDEYLEKSKKGNGQK